MSLSWDWLLNRRRIWICFLLQKDLTSVMNEKLQCIPLKQFRHDYKYSLKCIWDFLRYLGFFWDDDDMGKGWEKKSEGYSWDLYFPGNIWNLSFFCVWLYVNYFCSLIRWAWLHSVGFFHFDKKWLLGEFQLMSPDRKSGRMERWKALKL